MKFKSLWIAGFMLAATAGPVQAGIITADFNTTLRLLSGGTQVGWMVQHSVYMPSLTMLVCM